MTTSKTIKTVKCDHCNIVIKKSGISLSVSSSFGGIRLAIAENENEAEYLGMSLDFCSEKCLSDFFSAKIASLKKD